MEVGERNNLGMTYFHGINERLRRFNESSAKIPTGNSQETV